MTSSLPTSRGKIGRTRTQTLMHSVIENKTGSSVSGMTHDAREDIKEQKGVIW